MTEFVYGSHFQQGKISEASGANVDIPKYQESVRPQLKAILDRWVACTISVADAETQLRELFSAPSREVDVTLNNIEIKSTSSHTCSIKVNGQELSNCTDKCVLIIQAGHMPRFHIEGIGLPLATLDKINENARLINDNFIRRELTEEQRAEVERKFKQMTNSELTETK